MRLLLTLLVAATTASARIHVAPSGNDQASGDANRPVASLARALELTRQPGQPRHIIIHGGTWYDVSITLTAADSGLVIEAAPGERPVLYGGIPLGNWRKDGDRFYAAKLPEKQASELRLLEVNGRMASRARYPQNGTLTHLTRFDVPWMSTTGGGWQRKPTGDELTTLMYRAGDIPADLDLKSAEITVFHMWDESVSGVAGHDPQTHTLRLAPPLGHPPGAFGVRKYLLWNIREGMLAPGQWYHDRTGNRIVYWPLYGQDMSTAKVIIPTTNVIFSLRGTKEQKIRNVVIRGLKLAATNTPLITGGFAAAAFDGAISIDHAENCTFSDLTIANVAGQAINTRADCSGIRVDNCEIGPCGAGGIYVGGTKAVISDNHVRGVGRMYPSAVGIFRGGRDCLVSHNEVHDCTYSAINYGGTNNIIEYNLLYDCMKELHDGAAIYMFAARNCILRRNVARDFLDTGGYGASAYYLDERSEGCTVEENLSVNVNWPSHNHMCRPNTIRNNVFVVKGDAKITFPRSSGFALEGNVLYATGKISIENIDGVASWSKNILYSGAGKIEGVILDQYTHKGTVSGVRGDTVVADPLFMDAANGDFRYRPQSPAVKLGLRPIDVSGVGPRQGRDSK